MPSLKHVHSYVRYSHGLTGLFKKHRHNKTDPRLRDCYRCTDPECSHYTSRLELLGKWSKCGCGQEFLLNAHHLSLAVPKCLDCGTSQEARRHQAAKRVAGAIFEERENQYESN